MNYCLETKLYLCSPGSYRYDQARAYTIEFYQYAYNASIVSSADVFCMAYHNSHIIGCFGLYYSTTHNPLLAESYLADERLNYYLNGNDRNQLVEFGTLAINAKKHIRILPIMSAAMSIQALKQGFTHALYTSTKTWGNWIANYMLGSSIQLESSINFDRKNKAFKENWKYYFSKKRFCFGVLLKDTILGSKELLDNTNVEICNGNGR